MKLEPDRLELKEVREYMYVDAMSYIYGEELTQHEAERGISFNYTSNDSWIEFFS